MPDVVRLLEQSRALVAKGWTQDVWFRAEDGREWPGPSHSDAPGRVLCRRRIGLGGSVHVLRLA